MLEAGFCKDMVECLPVDPATWVRFPAGAGLGPSIHGLVTECSDSAIPNSLAAVLTLFSTWLEWSTSTQEFWVGILADPKDFPLGITSLVAAVIQ